MEKYHGMYLGMCISRMDPEKRGRVKIFVPEVLPALYERWNADGINITLTCVGNNLMNSMTEELREKLERILPYAEAASPVFGSSAPGHLDNATGNYQQTADPGPQSTTSNPDANAISPAATPGANVTGGIKPNSAMNGRLDKNNPAQLVGIGSYCEGAPTASRYLHPTFAANFQKMCEAFKQEKGATFKITDAYRSYEEQEKCVKEKGLYGQPFNGGKGLCARPGNSNHGLGLAVDCPNSSNNQHAWLAKNAPKFGFNTIPSEPWHWEMKASKISGEGMAHTMNNAVAQSTTRAETGEQKTK